MTVAVPVQTERQFEAAVVEFAKLAGWRVYHPYDSRRSEAGWPDLAMVRAGRLVLAELKSEKGRLSEAQAEWIEELRLAPIEMCVWRPSDWPTIEELLR
jgi:hypothetical protein